MKNKFLIGPVAWVALLAVLLAVWACLEPATLIGYFDAHGHSPVELMTLPVFAFIVPLVWWKCPFDGSKRRRTILCTMVTVVAIMAIFKELDLHDEILRFFYPDLIGENGSLVPGHFVKPNGTPLTGTPFKMRVLTNAAVPIGMKAIICSYFLLFFGTFVFGFIYLLKSFVLGVFRLSPAAWAAGCFGACGVMVQISDRLPAWLGHAHGLTHNAANGVVSSAASLCTALEEGGEFMLALFACIAIYLGSKEAVKCQERE